MEPMTPPIGLALSGGGSRAIAFHLGVLKALNELGILSQISAISTVSGGSVIGALWVCHEGPFEDFESECRTLLAMGFERGLIRRLLSLKPFPLAKALRLFFSAYSRVDLLAEHFDAELFHGRTLSSIPKHPVLIINATELNTGKNYKFGREVMGAYTTGPVSTEGVLVATAVAASAAYPVFLPTLAFKTSQPLSQSKAPPPYACLTDGGVYDNLGATTLLPDKSPEVSFLIQECGTLLVSDASKPYEIQLREYTRWISRMKLSMLTAMQRVRSLTYQHLYTLLESGKLDALVTIKMDSEDPSLNTGFSPQDLLQLAHYPTDFKAMPPTLMELFIKRGQYTAKVLIQKYIPHLVS